MNNLLYIPRTTVGPLLLRQYEFFALMTTQTPANRNVSHSLPPKQHVRRSARQGKTAGERALAAAAADDERYATPYFGTTWPTEMCSTTRDTQQKHKEKDKLIVRRLLSLGKWRRVGWQLVTNVSDGMVIVLLFYISEKKGLWKFLYLYLTF